MMETDKATIIRDACDAVSRGDSEAAILAVRAYPFVRYMKGLRGYTVDEAIRVFARDGFVDRYSGARLVNPAVLRTLSKLFPAEFPFQKNWKQSETHPAYWDLAPTIDHVIPITRGGEDVESNWVTTSMVRNASKANWTLDELGWRLLPPGDPREWDGLTRWLIRHVEANRQVEHDRYVIQWYRASRRVLN